MGMLSVRLLCVVLMALGVCASSPRPRVYYKETPTPASKVRERRQLNFDDDTFGGRSFDQLPPGLELISAKEISQFLDPKLKKVVPDEDDLVDKLPAPLPEQFEDIGPVFNRNDVTTMMEPPTTKTAVIHQTNTEPETRVTVMHTQTVFSRIVETQTSTVTVSKVSTLPPHTETVTTIEPTTITSVVHQTNREPETRVTVMHTQTVFSRIVETQTSTVTVSKESTLPPHTETVTTIIEPTTITSVIHQTNREPETLVTAMHTQTVFSPIVETLTSTVTVNKVSTLPPRTETVTISKDDPKTVERYQFYSSFFPEETTIYYGTPHRIDPTRTVIEETFAVHRTEGSSSVMEPVIDETSTIHRTETSSIGMGYHIKTPAIPFTHGLQSSKAMSMAMRPTMGKSASLLYNYPTPTIPFTHGFPKSESASFSQSKDSFDSHTRSSEDNRHNQREHKNKDGPKASNVYNYRAPTIPFTHGLPQTQSASFSQSEDSFGSGSSNNKQSQQKEQKNDMVQPTVGNFYNYPAPTIPFTHGLPQTESASFRRSGAGPIGGNNRGRQRRQVLEEVVQSTVKAFDRHHVAVAPYTQTTWHHVVA